MESARDLCLHFGEFCAVILLIAVISTRRETGPPGCDLKEKLKISHLFKNIIQNYSNIQTSVLALVNLRLIAILSNGN